MFSAILTLTLAAAMGQTPADTALLKPVPADAGVVIHVRGVTAIRDDLLAMLRAMSPTLADQAEGSINGAIEQMKDRVGEKATTSPFVVAIQLPKPDDLQSQPPLAIIVPSTNYEGVLKGVAGGGELKLERQEGGYDAFTDKDGQKIYSYKGDGWIAFGPEKDDLIKAIAAKPSSTLADKLAKSSQDLLLSGDVGLYLNVAAIQTQYADQIEEGKKSFMDLLDQTGAQMQGMQIEQAKQVYAALFEAIKQAETLTLSVDFDKAAFDLTGMLTVKADSDAAKTLKTAKLTSAEGLGKLPGNELGYMYLNFDPSGMEGLMRMNLAAAGGQVDKAALEKSIASLKAAGRQETIAAFSLAAPVSMISLTTSEHPEKTAESTRESIQSMKSSPVFKEIKVEENALEYKGFKLSKTTITFDIDKLAQQQGQGNEQVAEMMKRWMGGALTVYSGTDGKRFVSIVGASEADAKAKLDAVLEGGSSSIGQAAGYKDLRGRLPKEVGAMVLFNAQAMVKQIGNLAATFMGAEIKTPDMPKDTAFFGFSYAATSDGYRFDLVVPSTVGPVFERGFGSLMQAMQGQVGQ